MDIGPNLAEVLLRNLALIEQHANSDTFLELMKLHTDLVKAMLEILKEHEL